MTKRRTFGRIRQLRSGRFQARYPTPSNKEAPAPHTFATRRQAEQYLAEVQTDQLRGTWVDPTLSQCTLDDYAATWLKNRNLRPKTVYKYRGLLDRHVLPRFGHVQLGRIQPQDVRSWNAELAAAYPDTAAQAYRLLATILTLPSGRPPTVVALPHKRRSDYRNPERPVATPEEIAAAVHITEERYQLAILLAAWCHLRPQEILGLQRRDVDLDNSRLTMKEPDGVRRRHGSRSPKTDAGRRVFHVPENVIPTSGPTWKSTWTPPESWLFNGPNGASVTTRTLQRHWDKARKAIGRPELRLYDMRHSGLTLAAAGGASLADL